jgi:hypothetical protein
MTPLAKSRPRAKRLPAPFSVRDALSRSLLAMDQPPLAAHIERPKPEGQCLMRFALPLSLLPTGNAMRHGQPWKLAKLKSQCLSLMRAQLPTRLELPLPGRPQVLCVRFSSVEPDKYNDGFKVAVDCLVKMGLLVDDAPRFVDLHQWWEPMAPKAGFGVVEVWSGERSGG